MQTLYYAPGACSLSVHIVLEWVGANYSAVRVDPTQAAYQAINPAGAVPALISDSGQTLTQCSAILAYLSRRYPQADLDERQDIDKDAELHRWSAFITGDLHPAFFPVFKPDRYTVATDESSLTNVKAAGLQLVRKKLAVIEQHLSSREFFMGTKRTYLDAYSVPMVRWASMLPGDFRTSFAHVFRHHDAMLADPSVHRAMQEEKGS